MMPADPIPFTARTCFSCGKEFPVFDRERKCSACRAPRVRVSRQTRPGDSLTAREKHVVNLLLEGKRNKEIAAALHLTEGTIKEYLSIIYKKLQVTDRTMLIVKLLRSQNEIPLFKTSRV